MLRDYCILSYFGPDLGPLDLTWTPLASLGPTWSRLGADDLGPLGLTWRWPLATKTNARRSCTFFSHYKLHPHPMWGRPLHSSALLLIFLEILVLVLSAVENDASKALAGTAAIRLTITFGTGACQIYAARAILRVEGATLPYSVLGTLRLLSRALEVVEVGAAIAVAAATSPVSSPTSFAALALRWLASAVRLCVVSSPLSWGALLAVDVRASPSSDSFPDDKWRRHRQGWLSCTVRSCLLLFGEVKHARHGHLPEELSGVFAALLGGSAPDGKGTSLAAVGAGLERLLQEAEMAGPTNSSQDLTPLSAGLVARCQEACLLQHYAIAPCTYFDLAPLVGSWEPRESLTASLLSRTFRHGLDA